MREYPETQRKGLISLENVTRHPFGMGQVERDYVEATLGVQIARDGRVWICIDGVAFLRFSPHPDGKMKKSEE